jgi:hypothetical protein
MTKRQTRRMMRLSHYVVAPLGAAILCASSAAADVISKQHYIHFKHTSPKSVLFSEREVNNLMQVLRARELDELNPLAGMSALNADNDLLSELERRALNEEEERIASSMLPDFYVSSMLYRAANDWVVWVNKINFASTEDIKRMAGVLSGEADSNAAAPQTPTAPQIRVNTESFRLSSRNPTADEGRLEVASITPQHVTLAYRPIFAGAAVRRVTRKEEIRDEHKRFRNRLTAADIAYDRDSNLFTATLQTNQTLSLQMLRVLEGRIAWESFYQAGTQATQAVGSAQAEMPIEANSDPQTASPRFEATGRSLQDLIAPVVDALSSQ